MGPYIHGVYVFDGYLYLWDTCICRILKFMEDFSFFGPKNSASISRFLEVAQEKGRCQLFHNGVLNSV